jgi:hypothetical protein
MSPFCHFLLCSSLSAHRSVPAVLSAVSRTGGYLDVYPIVRSRSTHPVPSHPDADPPRHSISPVRLSSCHASPHHAISFPRPERYPTLRYTCCSTPGSGALRYIEHGPSCSCRGPRVRGGSLHGFSSSPYDAFQESSHDSCSLEVERTAPAFSAAGNF